ncbi:hypothetical protein [Nonomuraea sp. SYSU D8015]|uniref:hypothetical protein n=1 Tax=Nonomuraea sp. SYSU D8015 TaxID=2593644 RepID=UPI0016604BE8|nr:hypothetical protein [Nonomuraea sp. SYSU D8015]
MHAFIRRYRMGAGAVEDLMRTVDRQFAAQLSGAGASAPVTLPEGILGYYAVADDDGMIVTVTLFESEEHVRRARQAAENIRLALEEFQVEEVATITGAVSIARTGAIPDIEAK